MSDLSNTPLIIITNNFPFGKGEIFFDEEFKFLCEKFSDITIISKNTQGKQRVPILKNIRLYRYNRVSNFKEKISSLFYILLHLNQFIRLIRKEIRYFKKHFHLSFNHKESVSTIIHDLIKAQQLLVFLNQKNFPKEAIYYSYWMNSSALALSLFKNSYSEALCIARGHGSDIYFEANNKYIPFRTLISNQLDGIFTISESGNDYLSKLPEFNTQGLFVSKIGSNKIYPSNSWIRTKKWHFVSCSNLIPLKRVNKIIEVLSRLTYTNFLWTHFGDGPDMLALDQYAKSNLKTIDCFEFAGFKDNDSIQKFYAENNVDLFINLSASEGIPVSIMEAFSYGIPVLANDVGGISEIVNHDNGILVGVDDSPESIATKIHEFQNLTDQEIKNKRDLSFRTWEESYNISNNNLQFSKKIISLWKSLKNN